METNEKILELIKAKGPVIPAQIFKDINSNLLFTSAHLSDLYSQKKIRITKLKVGGSPLYYLQGQEHLLQNFSNYLHEKEKKAFQLLMEKKILRDKELDPVTRVAMREISDFAIPLEVTYENNSEILWKWYLLENEEAERISKEILTEKKEVEEKQKEEKLAEFIKKEKEETFTKLTEKPKIKKRVMEKRDYFSEEIKSFFIKNKIDVKSIKIVRKNHEIDFLIQVPSGIGNLEYYCKAKNKKSISENDLGNAYLQGQLKKLPVLYLAKGELTKKAKSFLTGEFKNIRFNKI